MAAKLGQCPAGDVLAAVGAVFVVCEKGETLCVACAMEIGYRIRGQAMEWLTTCHAAHYYQKVLAGCEFSCVRGLVD
jgi:hypothetical protein